MALVPDYDSFARAYQAGRNQVVYTRLAADLDTPVSLMLKLTGAQKDAFMLDPAGNMAHANRYWNEEIANSNALIQRARRLVFRVPHYQSGAELAEAVARAKQ